ncbi:hypothetical protein DL767_007789 [Monosporascus sp. MG133]|nr:hypothetical protein DL767_007789 [Monosporascus sp. MG133]
MRGLLWADRYYPSDRFTNDETEDDEKGLEVASMGEGRKTRVLYLGCRIARDNQWLRYNRETHHFSANPQFDADVEPRAAPAESTELDDPPNAAATF